MLTNWRDDVYTPGLSAVGQSILAVGTNALGLTWGAEYYRDQMNSSGTIEDLTTGDQTLDSRFSSITTSCGSMIGMRRFRATLILILERGPSPAIT